MNGAEFIFVMTIVTIAALFVIEQGVEWAGKLADWWERGERW